MFDHHTAQDTWRGWRRRGNRQGRTGALTKVEIPCFRQTLYSEILKSTPAHSQWVYGALCRTVVTPLRCKQSSGDNSDTSKEQAFFYTLQHGWYYLKQML